MYTSDRQRVPESHSSRYALFLSLEQIHLVGVLHADLQPRNVVLGEAGPVIIDFSHSELQHQCPGAKLCWELQEAIKNLQLDNDSISDPAHAILHSVNAGSI